MPVQMFASDKPVSLEEIRDLVPTALDSSIDSKLGGLMTILSVRSGRKLVMDFNAQDDEGNAESMAAFQSKPSPESFASDLSNRKLHFVLCNCNHEFADEVNEILGHCVDNGIVKYDTSDDVKLLTAPYFTA